MQNGHPECGVKQGFYNSVAPLKTVTGQYLVHAKLTKPERAFIARDLYLGDTQLIKPTMVQSAQLALVNLSYAFQAVGKSERERELIERSVLPLRPPAAVKALPAPTPPAAMAAELVNAVGIDQAFDLLVQANGH
jgi:hypothetical protein